MYAMGSEWTALCIGVCVRLRAVLSTLHTAAHCALRTAYCALRATVYSVCTYHMR